MKAREAWHAAVHGVTKSQTRQHLKSRLCVAIYAPEEPAMYGYICYICYVWLSVHAIMLYTGQGKMCSVTLCCDTKAEKA